MQMLVMDPIVLDLDSRLGAFGYGSSKRRLLVGQIKSIVEVNTMVVNAN